MRIFILFLFLGMGLTGKAQDEYYTAFRSSIPSGLGTEIRLPDPGLGEFNLESFQRSSGSINIMAIASDSLYHQVFSRYRYTRASLDSFKESKEDWSYKFMVQYMADSLPVIDFKKYDLVLYSACGHCQALCKHAQGLNSCHRSACQYEMAWFLREKSMDHLGLQVIMK